MLSFRPMVFVCILSWLTLGVGHSSRADSTAIKTHAKAIFSSIHQLNFGNPHGDVTLVEFLDYNCGFCKGSVGDALVLMKREPNLKIAIKEFPVLGPGSTDAAKVAIAVRMQDVGGGLLDADEKSFAFHRELMSHRGKVDKTVALAVARRIGCDMTRLQRDLNSKDIEIALEEVRRLAAVLGISGTPGYVIGDQVLYGAAGVDVLGNHIKAARRAGTTLSR